MAHKLIPSSSELGVIVALFCLFPLSPYISQLRFDYYTTTTRRYYDAFD